MSNRVVAIVGRPNVGKSAIFNRLAGGRIAIVHEESGVTRDRLMREVLWDGERFELIDTGGVCNVAGAKNKDVIENGIKQQVDAALEDAVVALMVVDASAGVVPMDAEVAAMLRKSGHNVIIAANKCDSSGRDGLADEFRQFGFPVFPVSALHDRGFEELMDPVLKLLPEADNATIASPLKVAVVGRPNVGKSSYINKLLQNDRVMVSDIPGTTRDRIDIPFVVGSGAQARHYLLMDTAGMRSVGKIDSSVERFSHFRSEQSIEKADVVVHVMQADQGPTSYDKRIASLIIKENKGCVMLVSKWDLMDTTPAVYKPMLYKTMPFMVHCPVVFVSSQTGYSIKRSVEVIDHVAAQTRLEMPTGVLNRTIGDACERVHPPSVGGKQLRVFYSTQTGVSPVRIKLFVNSPALVRDQYKIYLTKAIRSKFGLEGAPIVLNFSARRPEKRS